MGTKIVPAPETPTAPLKPPPSTPSRGRAKWLWLLLLCAAGAAGYRFYPQPAQGQRKPAAPEKAGGKRGNQVVPVVAAVVRRGDLGIYLTGLGSATAYNMVTIRSRVDGELMQVAFTEGQLVHQGDLLAVIDPRPFEGMLNQAVANEAKDEAALGQAKANLARDEAQAGYLQAQATRYAQLFEQRIVSKEQADQMRSSADAADQVVAADKATIESAIAAIGASRSAVNNARVQLGYTTIQAPLTGRIGLRLVDRGNIVHAADTNGMATITQLQPITVIFNLAQDFLPEVMNKWRAGQNLPVEAWDRDLKTKIATGKLLTIDNAIDPATGTARFKAEFPNEDNALFPNQFVNARLLVDTRRGTVIAPAAAVQHSPQSTFVYVVKSDQTAEMRNIVPGPAEGDDASVLSGLEPGEVVVVDGVDKLQNGTRVEARVPGAGPGDRSNRKSGRGK